MGAKPSKQTSKDMRLKSNKPAAKKTGLAFGGKKAPPFTSKKGK
jgi:hypothetical protein